MNPATPPPTPKPGQRFTTIVESLRRFIAARGPSHPTGPRLAGPLVVLLWSRLGRMIRRLAALAAHVEAGTLPKPRPRRPRTTPRPAPAPLSLRIPRRFGWLGQPVPEANASRSQLQYLLAQPDMQALIAAAPQMGRILRPLCHLLGLRPPENLRLPPRPRQPRPPQPRPSRAEPRPARTRAPRRLHKSLPGARASGPPEPSPNPPPTPAQAPLRPG